jgi:DNA-binding transcriptional MerR regulator
MRIGEVAEMAGVNVRTLRYYEQIGLLEAPQRRNSGYREYAADTVAEVLFIKKVQDLGFSLKEIEEFIRLRKEDESVCRSAWAFAQTKLEVIKEKIQSLTALQTSLESLVESCAPSPLTGECTLIEECSPDSRSEIPKEYRPAEPSRTLLDRARGGN